MIGAGWWLLNLFSRSDWNENRDRLWKLKVSKLDLFNQSDEGGQPVPDGGFLHQPEQNLPQIALGS